MTTNLLHFDAKGNIIETQALFVARQNGFNAGKFGLAADSNPYKDEMLKRYWLLGFDDYHYGLFKSLMTK